MTTVEKSNAKTTFKELAALMESDEISVVRFTNLEISGDESEAFTFSKTLRGHPSLEELHLKNIVCIEEENNFDFVVEMVMVSCPNFRLLELEDVPVRAKAICTMVYSPTLKTLLLPNNNFVDTDAKFIAEAIGANNSVETVDLSGNKISDAGCQSFENCLEKNTTVKEIILTGNSISAAKGTKIEAKLRARVAIAA